MLIPPPNAVYSIDIPEPLIDSDGTVSIPLNCYCSEDPTSFIITIKYQYLGGNEIITLDSGFDKNNYAFDFMFQRWSQI